MGNFFFFFFSVKEPWDFVLSHSDYFSSGLGPQHTPLAYTHWQALVSTSSAPISTFQTSNLALFFCFAWSSILVVLCLPPIFSLHSSLPYSVPQEAFPMECTSPGPLSSGGGQPMARPQQVLQACLQSAVTIAPSKQIIQALTRPSDTTSPSCSFDLEDSTSLLLLAWMPRYELSYYNTTYISVGSLFIKVCFLKAFEWFCFLLQSWLINAQHSVSTQL